MEEQLCVAHGTDAHALHCTRTVGNVLQTIDFKHVSWL